MQGGVGEWIVLHELGHALGLRGDNALGPMLANSDFDSLRYTMMSYNPITDSTGGPLMFGGFQAGPHAPMLLDILALQALYGPNVLTATGDNEYRFQVVDGWPIQAIWDAAGADSTDKRRFVHRPTHQ
jgi:serralysin